ncbi:nicotinate-nucleotide--dimethylbenzimidazole phosphoribosyltransferase [Gordonia sp. PDNC005]|uniref:nicotinate-nucleotide--dimethylbenzimidazole phosphoribosyltransferase n=1 Tax=unclassified Gordonia (in: high G+C Gram-positive bacteria) TaxID=2657482 RepID=UPI001963DE6D|nr:nicotinate-nucleotide--dimethylbenzimidazole phosphoribosyltransferase [Gordonia sp. PDNC005]QRY60897.1 nicotinate-nucleotide--dimethylbenzimidazole phosphoribosyltransferase [Gordonia sp. PDNC005]
MRYLVLGGTRSGKSAHAENLLAEANRPRYLATGAVDVDEAWDVRVDAHRARRGDHFLTVETHDPAAEMRLDPESPVLIDDLGSWVTTLLDTANAWDDPAATITAAVDDLCSAIVDHGADVVVVSPEVGMSVVAPTPVGRRFADEIGSVNSRVAQVCETVHLVVAGRVLELPARSVPLTAEPAPVDAETPRSAVEAPLVPVPVAPFPETISPSTSFVGAAMPDGIDAEVFPAVDPPSPEVADAARARHLTLTKPPGALGLLEDLGVWISACQDQCPPHRLTSPAVAVFAGDHGVAEDGVSAFPPEVTAQMVANIAAGGAAVNVLARRAGAKVHVFDMSVKADVPDGDAAASAYKVRNGSGDLRTGDAMTIAEARKSLAAGRAIADRLVDSGADLLIAGDMGIGNTTPAAVLIGTIADREPVVVVGRGTGINDATWIRKTAAIRDGMRYGRRFRNEPLALLAAVGGPDLAAMTGFYAQAALRRTPVLIDGVVTSAAALVAEQLAPGASAWWRAGHRSTEPAHGFALASLGLEPIVDMSMRLGEGTGALTALPIVASAVDVLIDMATFADAGVSDGG